MPSQVSGQQQAISKITLHLLKGIWARGFFPSGDVDIHFGQKLFYRLLCKRQPSFRQIHEFVAS
jgi:hypothetical protein